LNSAINGTSQYGIKLDYARGEIRLENNTLENSGSYGLSIRGSNNPSLTLYNNTVRNNANGIYFHSLSDNTISNNNVSNNGCGIYLYSSSGNTIYNNYFNNSDNAYDDGTNIWNVTPRSGTNIIGGPNLGGNYWSDYAGNDTDGDGLGEIPYAISGGSNKDHHPLVLTPTLISITLSNYTVLYGTVAPGESTNSSLISALNSGTVNETFLIRGADAYYELSSTWTLAESIGSDNFTHEFYNGSSWSSLNKSGKTLANNVPIGGNATFRLRITLPSVITTPGDFMTNVTIMATEAS
ncbi:MAG: hypothetical protein D4S01_02355, partial [Dehalococcoidia bacterium]